MKKSPSDTFLFSRPKSEPSLVSLVVEAFPLFGETYFPNWGTCI